MAELVSTELLLDYFFENIFVPEDRKTYFQILCELRELALERVESRSSFDKEFITIEFTYSAQNNGNNFYASVRLQEVPVLTDVASIITEVNDIMDYVETKILDKYPEIGVCQTSGDINIYDDIELNFHL